MEPILDTWYWKQRLEAALERAELHHAVFKCPRAQWEAIESHHRKLLDQHIRDDHSILDAGCGYGRLLTMLPPRWAGRYLGVDISPDLLKWAERLHGNKQFICGDLRDLSTIDLHSGQFHWAILISIRPMVRRNLGDAVWEKMETELRRVAQRLLFLEYDEHDPGSVE